MTSIVDPNRAASKSDVGSPSYAPSARNRSIGPSTLSKRPSSAVGSPTSSLVRSEQTITPLTRSRPRCSFRQERRLRFVLCFCSSQSPSPNIFKPVLSTTSCTGLSHLGFGFGRNVSPFPRRDRVEKSGTAITTPSSRAIERIKP